MNTVNILKKILFVFILSVASSLAFNSVMGNEWEMTGYVKSYGVFEQGVVLNGVDITDDQTQLQNAVRLMSSSQTDSGHDIQIHYEASPTFYNKTPEMLNNPLSADTNIYRIDDIKSNLTTDQQYDIYQNLDRANIQYHLQNGELTIGRQAMAFGNARMVNPSDIFLPYGLQTLNTEYRKGIDGLRYQHYLDDFFYLDMGIITGQDLKAENNAIFLASHYSAEGRDWNVMLIQQQSTYLLSAGLQTAIGDFGSWFESAYLDSKTDHYWRTSLGLDYAFNDSVFAMIEYHFNGAGSHNPNSYLLKSQTQPYEKYGVYLLGKHYLMPSVNVTVNPLLTVNSSLVFNVDDASTLLSIVAETSWSENQYSQLGLYQGLGKGLSGAANAPEIESEFGSVTLMLYASYGLYF